MRFNDGMLSPLRRFIRRLQASEKTDLSYLFSQADPTAPLPSRIDWLASLVEWLRDDFQGQTSISARIKFVLQWLERNPEIRQRSARVVRSVLRETEPIYLLTEVGLPTEPTFGRELLSRLATVLIPEYADPTDLAGVQARIFYEDNDAERLAAVPPEVVAEVVAWLRTGLPAGEDLIPQWRRPLAEAARILAARSLAITLRSDFSRRSRVTSLDVNPFYRLNTYLTLMIGERLEPGLFEALRQEIADGRRLLQQVRSHLEQTGVSVDLIYQLDRIRNDLARLSRLVGILEKSAQGEDLRQTLWIFWTDLIRGHVRDSDAGAILRKHLGLLSKKVVERTGHTGEHYITQTRSEYWVMLWTAAGGGVLTAGTAFLKYLHGAGGAPFVEFMTNGSNFAISFLIMHFLGFKLATKQPSMTAAALAGKLKEEGNQSDDEAFVDEIARIARSQFAAVAGNLIAVVPAAMLLNWLYALKAGHAYFTPEKATSFLESINPVLSATIFFAAWTGVLLWLSSMIAGWVENASVYWRLPDVIRTHPALRWMLGPKRTARLAEAYLHNVSGVVGAVVLGFLLAATPVFGKFFGLPLDVRHVTLSTGAAAYSVLALGAENIETAIWVFTGIGIAMIGLMNFGISFLLALSVAVRSRDLPRGRMRSIFRRALRRLLRRPQEFLFPVREEARK